jgi:hypothetical protein
MLASEISLDRIEVSVSPLRSQDQIVAEINALGAKAKQASDKADQYRATRRQNISELHKRWPDEWLQIVKEQCKIGRREAYKQVAIADGRTTEEKEREKDAAAKRRQRSAGCPALNIIENIEESYDAEDEPEHTASAAVSAQVAPKTEMSATVVDRFDFDGWCCSDEEKALARAFHGACRSGAGGCNLPGRSADTAHARKGKRGRGCLGETIKGAARGIRRT